MSNATQLSIGTWYRVSRQFRDILELCYIIVKFIHPLQQSAIGPWQPYNYPLTPHMLGCTTTCNCFYTVQYSFESIEFFNLWLLKLM